MSQIACPLCGNRFERSLEANRCHGGCPMGDKCNLVKCPGCGYEWPGDSRLVNWLKRLFRVGEPGSGQGPRVASRGEDIVQMKVRRP
ncbi:MAG: hypothetical protein HYY84_07970 [Deltaproteobacteria bacterium]|nr:hypothetical protein [Deltaproteobacteria bacterium]